MPIINAITPPLDEQVGAVMQTLAATASVEVVPRQIREGRPLSEILPGGTRIYVPFLPKADFTGTIDACRRLVADGMQPVPHLPARAVQSAEQLVSVLAALGEFGVDSLLLIAGDRRAPAGPFRDTLDVLETGLLVEGGFRRIGIAGHPEGHMWADDATVLRALATKVDYARATGTDMWIVSQFVFSAERVIGWLKWIRDAGCDLPAHVGVAGPASLTTLISYAAQCGVDASTRGLIRRPGAARLLGRWAPEGLVRKLAHHRLEAADNLLHGIHLFSFGGVDHTARWLQALRLQARADQMVDDGSELSTSEWGA